MLTESFCEVMKSPNVDERGTSERQSLPVADISRMYRVQENKKKKNGFILSIGTLISNNQSHPKVINCLM